MCTARGGPRGKVDDGLRTLEAAESPGFCTEAACCDFNVV